LEYDFETVATVKMIILIPQTSASFEITEPNSVHMLLLLPQYIIITAGEIMFAITGLEFSYSQAPVSMKSVLQACFLLTSAIGNLIIVIIESAKIFDKQVRTLYRETSTDHYFL
jgi:dipeptide/tripeptide permease